MFKQAASIIVLFFVVAACSSSKKNKLLLTPKLSGLSHEEKLAIAEGYLAFYRFGLSDICAIKNPPEQIQGLSAAGLPDVILRDFDPHHSESVKTFTGASVDLRTDNNDQVYRYFGKEENRLMPHQRELYLILMGTKVRPQYHFCSQTMDSKTTCHLDEFMTQKENVCEFIMDKKSVEELNNEERLQAILNLWSSVQVTRR